MYGYDSNDEEQNDEVELKHKYPKNLKCDFSKLSDAALRRYRTFYNLLVEPHASRTELILIVANHFHNKGTYSNPEYDVLETFMERIQGGKKEPMYIAPAIQQSIYQKQRKRQKPKTSNQSLSAIDDTTSFLTMESIESAETTVPTSKKKKRKPTTTSTKKKKAKAEQQKPDEDPQQELYCICKSVSQGKMIACDNEKCPDLENWYHWKCVGLPGNQPAPEIWYCPKCQDKVEGEG